MPTIAVAYGALILFGAAPIIIFAMQQRIPQYIEGTYCVSLLPAALVGLRWPRLSGLCFVILSAVTLAALWTEEIERFKTLGIVSLMLNLAWWTFVMSLSGSIGLALIRG